MSFWSKMFGSKNEVIRDDLPQIANILFTNYCRVRDRIDEFSTSTITVGNTIYQAFGEFCCDSGFLAICVRSENNGADISLAQSLGMEVEYIEGRYYYQVIVRTALSNHEKNMVLNLVAESIRKTYTNDYLNSTDSYLICGADMLDFIEEMGSL